MCDDATATVTVKSNTENWFQDRLSLYAGQKYYRMLILSTFIKLPFAIKTFVLSIFDWSLRTGITVLNYYICVVYLKRVCAVILCLTRI